jgi:hypothetical protein
LGWVLGFSPNPNPNPKNPKNPKSNPTPNPNIMGFLGFKIYKNTIFHGLFLIFPNCVIILFIKYI